MTLRLGSSIVDAKKYSDSFVSLCGFFFSSIQVIIYHIGTVLGIIFMLKKEAVANHVFYT